MNTVLVVTADEEFRARLLRSLGAYSVFEAASDAEALRTLRLVDIDVVLRESSGSAEALNAFVASAKVEAPTTLIIALGPPAEEDSPADFVLPEKFTARDLDSVLRHALDKRRLQREVRLLRSSSRSVPAAAPSADEPFDGGALARALKAFTGVFAAGFDLRRVMEMFLDSLGELIQPTRMALLLASDRGQEFRIAASRGLAPQIVQSVRLPAAEGLARWLAAEARPARLEEIADHEIARELKILQAVVVVPLLAHGELVAILALGQPVFGAAYGRRQMQTLFDLATHLATVIRDIDLHQQLRREKEFTERILSHMSSGVITIDRDHKIGTFNRRAEEILQVPAQAVLGQDLRTLPSPLGDLLFDTLASGRLRPRAELQLALRRLWLEVSTYPIRDEDGVPLGAVLVFEDLTAQKELAAQKREAEQFQLLTRVVARIADEIKNPLVSISTFIELIGERYDDPDFRKHFSSVVRRDVRRLVEVFEKLAALVTEGELHFATVDAQEIVAQLADAIDLADEELGKRIQVDVTKDPAPQLVKTDGTQLRKALSYLIRYLAHNSPADVARISLSVGGQDDAGSGASVRIMVGSRTAAVTPDRLDRLFDPVQMVQESLIDVGPAVSQRLVEALGGRLRVRQARNELAFVVTLPAVTS